MRSAASYGMGHKPCASSNEIPKAKYPTTGDGNVFQQHQIVRLLACPALALGHGSGINPSNNAFCPFNSDPLDS
jgi:hypothetical protein